MANVTIGFGLALLLTSRLAVGAGGGSLMPWLSMVLVGLGLVARAEKLRMHAMHGAAMVGLLGAIVSCAALVRSRGAATVVAGGGAAAHAVAALLCVAFLALCVRSFVRARRARASQDGSRGAAA